MEKGQLNDELKKLRLAYQRVQEEKNHQSNLMNQEIQNLRKQVNDCFNTNKILELQVV
jgi:hypothetical protein